MFLIIWQYTVKPGEVDRFVAIYNSEGRWAEFFRDSSGYQGTVLVKSNEDELTYVTLDYWDSEEDYHRFVKTNADEYAAIDKECDNLAESEIKIGEYETP
jgi:heme-degrading monooxygenase HmoA